MGRLGVACWVGVYMKRLEVDGKVWPNFNTRSSRVKSLHIRLHQNLIGSLYHVMSVL